MFAVKSPYDTRIPVWRVKRIAGSVEDPCEHWLCDPYTQFGMSATCDTEKKSLSCSVWAIGLTIDPDKAHDFHEKKDAEAAANVLYAIDTMNNGIGGVNKHTIFPEYKVIFGTIIADKQGSFIEKEVE